ncbi:MAG: DUF2130 domain-containing protein [Planctomycetaceae bacterium]|jgi:hypothetical protein|nr:DUF2130 domain-containing protein [Planctomycetaceae bacterium]
MQNTVRCPKCNAEIDVEAILGQQIEEKYKRQFQQQISSLEKDYETKKLALTGREQALKEQSEAVSQEVERRTQTELAKQRKALEEKALARAKSELEVELTAAKEQAAESAQQLKALKETQLANERLKRQLESQRADIELEFEKKAQVIEEDQRRKFLATLNAEREEIAKRESEKNEERVAELEKQLSDARKAAEDAVRKAEQRSQQLQGEIQELNIENFLKAAFPFDQVYEVKKGTYGADVIQIVRNSIGKEAGTIMYESKNTQSFGGDWIDKMKAEAADANASMLVLITKAMPKGTEHTEFIDGVWVCPYKEFQGTAQVLRESLIKVSEAYASQTNKEDKVHRLYDYLTNGRFADQIKAVISGFNDLRDGYEKEKTAMQKIWKKRDSQLEMMVKNTTDFITQIQIIGGADIPQLASPEGELLTLTND